jgi:hypothetical protein
MQLFAIISIICAYSTVANGIPRPEYPSNTARSLNGSSFESGGDHDLAVKNNGASETKSASSSLRDAKAKTTTQSTIASAAAKTATSTVDVDPDFDLAAATSAEKAAAVSSSYLLSQDHSSLYFDFDRLLLLPWLLLRMI